MELVISKKSLHYRIYKLVYGKYSEDPTNLCPYFWKTILALILLVPTTIYYIPLIMINEILRWIRLVDVENDDSIINVENGFYEHEHLAVGFICNAFVFCLYFMIGYFISVDPTVHQLGELVWVILIGALLFFGIRQLIMKYRERRDVKTGKIPDERNSYTYLLKNFIKSKYNRYCPKINWVDGKKSIS